MEPSLSVLASNRESQMCSLLLRMVGQAGYVVFNKQRYYFDCYGYLTV